MFYLFDMITVTLCTPPPSYLTRVHLSILLRCVPAARHAEQTHVGPAATVLETGPRGLRPGGAQGRATLNLVASVGLQDQVLIAGADFKGKRWRGLCV